MIAMARNRDEPRRALQGLWGLYVSGGFNETVAAELLRHPGEYVRAWTVRLLGDDGPGGRKGEQQQNRTCGPSNCLHREDSIK